MDLKVTENANHETIKNLEKEKRALMEKADKDLSNLKKESDIKVEKLKNDLVKLDYELKLKDDQIMNLNFSIDKINTLNGQKIEFLESETTNYKNRYEMLKSENLNLIVENEDLQGKIDDMKSELNKKKMLEFEMEKLKTKDKKFSESSTNFFSSTLRDGLKEESSNFLHHSVEKESLSNLIMKTNLENTKQQLEETKKIYEDVIASLKENLGDLPQNIAKLLEGQK
jgi:chromosome segregation ATPase